MEKIGAFILLICIAFASGAGLTDHPIVGGAIQYLDGSWSASGGAFKIVGNVPGDLITDLQVAKVIGDPIYETVWLDNSSIWSGNDWVYQTNFTFNSQGAKDVLLVFDGVKMGASITLNGVAVGQALDQFLRYVFPVGSILQANNELKVTFPKDYGIDVQGRFMACTGGWDWAPYSNTHDQHGALTLSEGIWKSVYVVAVPEVAITYVVPQVKYLGDYPVEPLTDTTHAPFSVNVTVHIYAPAATSGVVKITSDWGATNATQTVNLVAGNNVVQVSVIANDVGLWWPSGLGPQKLYNFTVAFSNPSGVVQTTRRIGFKVFALVTSDDQDPATLTGINGSGNFTMRFRVNGANIFSRGANMIPLEEYEGRANAEAFRILVNSVVEAHFNTLRIWGGGVFLYDEFYDACDELGVLIYHDMMYAQQGHSPAETPTQDAEIRHQIRRLSHHPSIVIWDGCNECGGGGVYTGFVITTVAEEDQSRIVWPSSPSYGWSSGVDLLWGTPNGKPLVSKSSGTTFETHGPYQHGSGFKAVNGDANINNDLFNPNIPPQLDNPSTTGPYVGGYYASEFGCVAMSSFESMSPTLSPDHWSLHAPPMYQRNYPCDNVILEYFGAQNLNLTGTVIFQKQLYQCLVGQALNMKSNIENRRSGNVFGTLIWQLGEIWPTGGWGSIEYASPEPGQVVGGRWKPLHYFLKSSVFADVIATCGTNANCYVKNDTPMPFSGVVTLNVVHLTTGQTKTLQTAKVTLEAGAGITQWFCAEATGEAGCTPWNTLLPSLNCNATGSDCIIDISVSDAKGNEISNNVLALTVPKNLALPQTHVTFNVSANSNGGADITLQSNAVAVYTILTTTAQGRFSDNVLLLLPGSTVVTFIPYGSLDIATLKSTLRVEHVQLYQ